MDRRAYIAALERMERQAWGAYLSDLRRRDAPPPAAPVDALTAMVDGCNPGHPLGKGMPTGRPLRADGDTHRHGWMRILRFDLCAYCGRAPEPGAPNTVDHIEPRSRSARGLGGAHSWLNYTAACMSCNGGKSDMPLLTYLLRRKPLGKKRLRRVGEPAIGSEERVAWLEAHPAPRWTPAERAA
jgi:5-methylcytosine-specific restriction endonuclease McrA